MRDDVAVGGRRTQLDLCALAALGCYLVALIPGLPLVLAGGAGLLLCFVLVGAVWAVALLPPGRRILVRLVTATAVVCGSGIAGGMVLNLLPSGLTRFNWLTYGLLVTGIGYLVARVRRHTVLLDNGIRADLDSLQIFSRPTVLKVTASAAALSAAVLMTVTSHEAKDRTFTELWLVPNSDLNSPVRAIQATVGVGNHEAGHRVYTLRVDSGKQVFTARVNLAAGDKWSRNIYIEGDEARVDLYRGTKTDGAPYRTVWVARR